ncbi:MAG: hypothetical protein Tsb0026_05130 [Sulfuricaulis sp.]
MINVPKALEDSAAVFGLGHVTSIRQVCTQRQCSDYLGSHQNYDEIEAKLASNFKRNLRRLRRRAEKTGKLEYRSSRDPQEIEKLFEFF